MTYLALLIIRRTAMPVTGRLKGKTQNGAYQKNCEEPSDVLA